MSVEWLSPLRLFCSAVKFAGTLLQRLHPTALLIGPKSLQDYREQGKGNPELCIDREAFKVAPVLYD